MNKSAATSYPIHQLIRNRWSPRSFDSRIVESVKLIQMLEAARWAPSWRNDQPWRFIVTTKEDPVAYQRLFDCLSPGNQRWACLAPVLMLVIAKRGYDHGSKPNPITLYDTGQAVAQLAIEALSHGLYVHQMGGIDHERIHLTYGIPPGYQPVVALAIGYLGQITDLAQDLRRRENAQRTRLPLSDLVLSNTWGQPFM